MVKCVDCELCKKEMSICLLKYTNILIKIEPRQKSLYSIIARNPQILKKFAEVNPYEERKCSNFIARISLKV